MANGAIRFGCLGFVILFVSMLRKPDYDALLGVYFKNLERIIHRMGSDISKTFDFTDLLDEQHKFEQFGLVTSSIVNFNS